MQLIDQNKMINKEQKKCHVLCSSIFDCTCQKHLFVVSVHAVAAFHLNAEMWNSEMWSYLYVKLCIVY